MKVTTTRTLECKEHPTVGDLRALLDGMPDDAVVDVQVKVQKADRPYETDRTTVALRVHI